MDEPDVREISQSQIQERACECCGVVLPLTPRYWKRLAGTQYAYQPSCKQCLKRMREKRRINAFETKKLKELTNAVKREPASRNNLPHVTELLESLYSVFGGVTGVANQMALTYYNTRPGSRLRGSILADITRLTAKASEAGATQKPLSLMSDEELEAHLAKRLETAAAAQKALSVLRDGFGNDLDPIDLDAARQMRELLPQEYRLDDQKSS